MLQAGFARADVTVFDRSMALLGWGVPAQVPERVGAPLHARALVVRDVGGRSFALVVVDLCFVTTAIRDAVVERLRARHPELGLAERTLITATHTHAGPNGISDHLYFAISAPGISLETRRTIVDGIVEAIVCAHARLSPTVATYAVEQIGLCEAATFNRSWFAYSSNPEVTPVHHDRRDEAVDRRVRVLSFRDPTTNALQGVVSWFPLHGTSLHSDMRLVHPDHKGVAASDLERQLEPSAPGVVAMFAQEAAGDVTPNYRFDGRRGFVVGRYDDDLDNAQHAADVQRRAVLRALETPGVEVDGPVRVVSTRIDLARAEVDPRFVAGREGVRTRPAVLGFGMAEGTAEGPGPLALLAPGRRAVARFQRRFAARRDSTLPFIELGRGPHGRVFGVATVGGPVLGALVGERAPFLADALQSQVGSFVPERAPVRLASIGRLVLAGMPCEPTTVAGHRVRAALRAELATAGVPTVDVIVAAYADDYLGYVTTPEEYVHQHYEAACTFFGPHTLDAYRTGLVRMVASFAREEGLA